MNLQMDFNLAAGYKAGPQIARILTEKWFQENMYCPCCPSHRLHQTKTNTKVVDFACNQCNAEFQLKAKAGSLGRKLRDAAYQPMRERITSGSAPHFAFLSYDSARRTVSSLLLVLSHFLTLASVEPCRPLAPTARRAGWIGCNILTDEIPPEGRVHAVVAGVALPESVVRSQWERFKWLRKETLERRAWTKEVLSCVHKIKSDRFSLEQIYSFEKELAKKYPYNFHIRAKLRQQLQLLRDQGVLKFLGRGEYQKI